MPPCKSRFPDGLWGQATIVGTCAPRQRWKRVRTELSTASNRKVGCARSKSWIPISILRLSRCCHCLLLFVTRRVTYLKGMCHSKVVQKTPDDIVRFSPLRLPTEDGFVYKRKGTCRSISSRRMNALAAFWTPWTWSGDDDGPASNQLQHREPQEQHHEGEGDQQNMPHSAIFSRPQSAPAPSTKRTSASTPQHQVPQPEGGGDDIGDGAPTLRSFQKRAEKSRSTGHLPGKRRGRRVGDQASVASPDFRRLGPSDFRSTPLAGCDFNALPTELHDQPTAAAAEDQGRGSKFWPETLMARRRSSSGLVARLDRLTKTKRRPATFRPATAPATDHGRSFTLLEDKNDAGRLNTNASLGKTPSLLLLGGRSGDDGRGGHDGTGGTDDVGDDADDSDSGSGLTWSAYNRAPPSLSTQSSSASLGSTSTSLAATLELWTKRELAAAKRAVSSRPQRSRLCLALRAHESTSAGMAAAQRSHRGAFVMSKMGNAKARSAWRP